MQDTAQSLPISRPQIWCPERGELQDAALLLNGKSLFYRLGRLV